MTVCIRVSNFAYTVKCLFSFSAQKCGVGQPMLSHPWLDKMGGDGRGGIRLWATPFVMTDKA